MGDRSDDDRRDDDRRDDRRDDDRRDDDRRDERRDEPRGGGGDRGGGKGDREKKHSLLVRNLDRCTNVDFLRDTFSKYGEVKDVYMPRNHMTREPKGFAFIEVRGASVRTP